MNRITKLFNITYPIVQGGMVWCSGWRLAAAVSNAGGLGLIGAGSMRPELLIEHIRKIRASGVTNFGVNIPLLYSYAEEFINIVIREQVPIVFTSAGSPKKYTNLLKDNGIKVVHVVSSAKFAAKSEQAGVDAVVAEGFEAGGHNGREETTTLTLVELVKQSVGVPVIAAGGIASGRAILAVQNLGAEGVQIGSLFAASEESSASSQFKKAVIEANEGDTILALKKLAPVRMLKNHFCNMVLEQENTGTSKEHLLNLLGKGRAKKGIFDGDLEEGELEIGQSSSMVSVIKPVRSIMKTLIAEYREASNEFYSYF
ncbi:MAG TPA: nitronate monooxygenase [Salinivirga sp.]|uniref:NAD(P)H-dependent flavin oxidoreductase n=1 Tax=Salinivirga sp. TaxID=1970192 RepID=UPI002B485F80|nr:nitronate monooxygenase [Salinivirga sp.]HKK59879.1 nitronate monooxygenase [Salinivirga sp.]